MRSKLAAALCPSLVGIALFTSSVAASTPAGGAPLPSNIVTTIHGHVTSLQAAPDGSLFATSMDSSTGAGEIVPIDPTGNQGTPTTIPAYCGQVVEPLGMAVFPGTNGTDYLSVQSNSMVWTNIQSNGAYLYQLPANTYISGVAVSPADEAGHRSVYFAINDIPSGAGRIEVMSIDSSGNSLSTTEVTDASLTYLSSLSLVDGNVYVTSWSTGDLFRISGGVVSLVVPHGTFQRLIGVTSDGRGGLFTADNATDTLFDIASDGSVSTIGTYGVPTPPVGSPTRGTPLNAQFVTALAFDSSARSLVLAQIDTHPPVAPRRCASLSINTAIRRLRTAPSAPSAVEVVAAGNAATVSWTAPADLQSGDRYTVTALPGGASCTVDSPATSCTVNGLSAMTTYDFRVVAQSQDGLGDAAATATATTGLAATGSSPALLSWGGLLLSSMGLALLGLRRRLRPTP